MISKIFIFEFEFNSIWIKYDFLGKSLLAYAIEIALNVTEISLSKIPRAEVELPSARAISEEKVKILKNKFKHLT